jgi:hypothetical protein
MAVAANAAPFTLPYSLLALDPTGCGTNFINGNGASVTTNGRSCRSSCPSGAVALRDRAS